METLQRTANRGSISTGYDIDNSLKMESDNSESMTRTPSSSGNRKTWTLSFWFKRTELGATERLFEAWDGSTGTSALFDTANKFLLDLTAGGNYFTSTAVFRDTSAWYHFVIRVDTTQGTASERARIYVNGSELAGSWNSNIGQNTDLTWNQNVVHYFGVFHNTGNFVNGYYAEVINVDGTSLAPTAFGEFDSDSGIWKPINASPTYGTNGFKLEFKSSGSLGADTSGNGHTWSLLNLTSADQATDTPTNNFTTLNVNRRYNGGSFAFTDGGTVLDNSFTGGFGAVNNTIRVNKGKWYAEFAVTVSGNVLMNGNVDANFIDEKINADFYLGSQSNKTAGAGYYSSGTTGADAIYYEGTYVSSGVVTSADDIISVAMDCDNNKVHFAVNGSWTNSSDPANNTNGFAMTDDYQYFCVSSIGDREYRTNFGGYTTISISSAASDENGYGTFEYAPPSGFYSLCTKNLAEFG
jgi:hypothetical protein